jgi:thiol-disulfide isomerase/thioredoxin
MTALAMLRVTVAAGWLAAFGPAFAQPELGGLPPADLGVDLKGEPVLATAFPGKAMVITFWATWCPYCLKELPILHNIQNKVGQDRLQVVAVNTEERAVFRRAAKVLEGLSVLHSRDVEAASQTAYGVSSLPHMVIVGRDGKIVAIHKGYGEGKLGQIAADINRALAVGN